MSQRLTISFTDSSNDCFLTAYYYWYGYTSSMLAAVNDLVKEYAKFMNGNRNMSPKQGLLEAFYSLGAGFSKEAPEKEDFKDALEQFYPDSKPHIQWNTDRDDGIVDITEGGMSYSEAFCDYSTDLKLCDDGSICFVDSDVFDECEAEEFFQKSQDESFEEAFPEVREILLETAEEIRKTGEFDLVTLSRKLETQDFGTYLGDVLISENGDNTLCWKKGDIYLTCDPDFAVNNMSRSYFVDLTDSYCFDNPEAVRILAPIA